jgi:hypothetical protein
MTLREKIADWITGGDFSKSVKVVQRATALAEKMHEVAKLRAQALQAIAAMETPSANATVRRMARTAREALK